MLLMRKNETHNLKYEVLFENCQLASNFWLKFKGLMMQKNIKDDYCLYFPGCNSIHMFFMKMEIDVIFLDKNGVVVQIETAKRHKMYSNKEANSTVECKKGSCVKKGIKVGDLLLLRV